MSLCPRVNKLHAWGCSLVVWRVIMQAHWRIASGSLLWTLLPPIQGKGKTRYPWCWNWGLARTTAGHFLKLLAECPVPLNAAQHKQGKTLLSGFLDCQVLLLPSSMIRETFPSLAPIVLYMKETEIEMMYVVVNTSARAHSWSYAVLGISVIIL